MWVRSVALLIKGHPQSGHSPPPALWVLLSPHPHTWMSVIQRRQSRQCIILQRVSYNVGKADDV
jgi:hypothetical protein